MTLKIPTAPAAMPSAPAHGDSDPAVTSITLRHDPQQGFSLVASPAAVVFLKWLWSRLLPLFAAALAGRHFLS
jgi:hypothetical protein